MFLSSFYEILWLIVWSVYIKATDTIAELESQVTQLKQALQDTEFQRQRQLRVRIWFELCYDFSVSH